MGGKSCDVLGSSRASWCILDFKSRVVNTLQLLRECSSPSNVGIWYGSRMTALIAFYISTQLSLWYDYRIYPCWRLLIRTVWVFRLGNGLNGRWWSHLEDIELSSSIATGDWWRRRSWHHKEFVLQTISLLIIVSVR